MAPFDLFTCLITYQLYILTNEKTAATHECIAVIFYFTFADFFRILASRTASSSSVVP